MTLGIRGKTFLVSLVVITTVAVIAGFYLEYGLRHWIETRITAELLRNAKTARELVRLTPNINAIETMDPIADLLGETMQKRITLSAGDGRVLGDSKLTPAEISTLENHKTRPEVIEALRSKKVGTARRFSTTLGVAMIYVAVPIYRDEYVGIVRVELSLVEVEESINHLRMLLLITGGLILVLTIFMSGIASHLLTRTLRSLVNHARQVADQALGKRFCVNAKDEISSLAGTFNLIAEELAAAVASLDAQRHRLEAVLEGMSDGVFTLDKEKKITLINQTALTLLSLKHSPIGQKITTLIADPEMETLLKNNLNVKTSTTQIMLSGNQEHWVSISCTQESSTAGWVIVMHDVTDLHRLNLMRREFVANVSHELRTPVSIVLGYTDTLLGGAIQDPIIGQEMLTALRRQAVRLSTIIADLLRLSRIDAGHYDLEIKPVAVASMLTELSSTLQNSINIRQVNILIDIDEETNVLADSDALACVFINLLDNAIKYGPENGRVTVTAHPVGDEQIRIQVQDEGSGIASELRPHLFERFYRVDPGRSRKIGGSGLGLAIVKSFVETMNGQVGMEPGTPHGSSFWITLPKA